ncbi:MAG: exosortase H [Xanthomonadales bacterium]|nr:exosortase H [Xanthomonadales bacterium]
MLGFFLRFSLLLLLLFTARVLKPVQEWVTLPFTALLADVSAAIIKAFDREVGSQGVIIYSTERPWAVEIAAGCDGIEGLIILFSAILAFPAPWRYRLIGMAIGFVAVQGLNLVRIISLFYLGQWSETAFEWFHLYLWQALIILDAMVVWLLWLRYLPRPGARVPAGATA